MSKEAPKRRPAPKKLGTLSAEEQLRAAREIVRREAAGVWKVSYRLNSSFCEAIKLLYTCKGSAIITGMGKAARERVVMQPASSSDNGRTASVRLEARVMFMIALPGRWSCFPGGPSCGR